MTMLKCDPRVFARCPYKGSCVSLEHAEFTEGSDCDRFNQKVLNAPVTNGDRIRMMNDMELSKLLCRFDNLEDVLHYCQNKPECNQIVQNGGAVPEAECRKCLVRWLRAPAYKKVFAHVTKQESTDEQLMDLVMQLHEILEGHCAMNPDRECSNSAAPDCVYCLAKHLVERGVTVG